MRWHGIGYRAQEPYGTPAPIDGDIELPTTGELQVATVRPLYLALNLEGLLLETGQGFGNRFDPLTIRAYEVDVEDIVDLRTEADRAAAGVELASMACSWQFDSLTRRFIPSWVLADDLIAQGAAGMLAPSLATNARPSMANLVLWRWGPKLPYRVSAVGRKLHL